MLSVFLALGSPCANWKPPTTIAIKLEQGRALRRGSLQALVLEKRLASGPLQGRELKNGTLSSVDTRVFPYFMGKYGLDI